jgi:hypothetical protein
MHVPTSAYFSFDVKFYEQSRGVAMGFPFYPAIPDVFKEDFEDMILSQATHKLLCWFCYTNDTFVIWPHGPEKLVRFVSLLHIDISRTPGGSLDRNVYREPTHTSLYQNHESHNHHSNKQAVLATLSHRQGCKKVVTRKAFVMSRSPLRPHLGKTGYVLGRHRGPRPDS